MKMEELMDNENLWHIHELIFGYLDHDTVEICRKVCKSWNESLKRISTIIYLLEFGDRYVRHPKEKVLKFFPGWKNAVEKFRKQASNEDLQEVKDSLRKLVTDDCKCLYLPLHQAASNGDVKLMELILNTSLDLNAKTSSGHTALHLACQYGKTEIVQLLITSPKDFSIDLNARNNNRCSALHLACKNSRTEIVELLIKSSKHFSIDFNARNNKGWTALHFACQNSNTEIVELLIKSSKDLNIDLNAKDDEGCTALHLACEIGITEIVELMITSSKDYYIDLNAKDDFEYTALHWACQLGRKEAVELMMKYRKEFGIDIKARDNEGKTPLDIAFVRP